MSVNCYLVMPPQTNSDHVLNALGALAGNKCKSKLFSSGHGEYLDWTPRTKANGKKAGVPRWAETYKGQNPDHAFMRIPTWNDPTSGYDDGLEHEGLYGFDCDYEVGNPGDRVLYVKSTAWWIAACCRLAQMFGGKVVANDCTDRVTFEVDYRRSGAYAIVDEYHDRFLRIDEAWDAVQSLTFMAEPLTEAELRAANRYAAYKMND